VRYVEQEADIASFTMLHAAWLNCRITTDYASYAFLLSKIEALRILCPLMNIAAHFRRNCVVLGTTRAFGGFVRLKSETHLVQLYSFFASSAWLGEN